MAEALWGRVYFKDIHAGELKQEPNGRCVFTYDSLYLSSEAAQAIAFSFPLSAAPYICEKALHPFFDNLVSEGLFREKQAKVLGISPNNHFALLLGFGFDLAGAVSIVDPEPHKQIKIETNDEVLDAALLSRGSLSGVQRKLLVVKEGRKYRPAKRDELSTHIAKFSSDRLSDIIELEYLSTLAIHKLLPDDQIVELEIGSISGIDEPALIVKRFDRTASGKRIHFEEFNQLLGKYSGDSKYDGAYEDMGNFISTTKECLPIESERLYRRILVALLTGNTDAHFKNFAMFHTRDGLRLTPSYDQVAAAYYKPYQTIALQIDSVSDLNIGSLKAKHLIHMAKAFGLNEALILNVVEDLGKRLPIAQQAIATSDVGNRILRDNLLDIMEKRWKGTFSLIGQLISKKQS